MAPVNDLAAGPEGLPVPQWETSDPGQLPAAPRVSVLMIVYNHALFLDQAIGSVVAQRCSFPFELIIGEDCSSDGSLEIALDYQKRYPQIVRVIHSPANVGMNANSRRVRAAARGEYLAWCEGDDYWCADDKIECQASLLDADPRLGAVHTDWVRAVPDNHGGWKVLWDQPAHARTRGSLLQGDLFPVFYFSRILRTCTLMFRRRIALECDGSEFGRKDYRFGDAVTSLFITSAWRVAYIPEVTSVYRESQNSVLRSGVDARIRFLRSALDFDLDARRIFSSRGDYPSAYRWELAVGLLLWSLRARDWDSTRFALGEIRRRFGLLGFFVVGVRAIRVHIPRLRRRSGRRPAKGT